MYLVGSHIPKAPPTPQSNITESQHRPVLQSHRPPPHPRQPRQPPPDRPRQRLRRPPPVESFGERGKRRGGGGGEGGEDGGGGAAVAEGGEGAAEVGGAGKGEVVLVVGDAGDEELQLKGRKAIKCSMRSGEVI